MRSAAVLIAAAAPAAALPPAGPHKVTQKQKTVSGMKTGNTVRVSIPDGAGPYPLVSFAHGVIDNGYTSIQKTIASYGFVVVAPLGCTPMCDINDWAYDQMHVLDLVAAGQGTDADYAKANVSNVGLAGHSYGGWSTLLNAPKADARVRAAFHLHPCGAGSTKAKVSIPTAYVTGSLDTVCSQTGVWGYYNSVNAQTKYYANMYGIVHQDPEYPPPTGGHWDRFVGEFFRCYLLGDTDGCAYMDSDTSDTLCKAYPMLAATSPAGGCYTPTHPAPGPGPAPAPSPPAPGPAPGPAPAPTKKCATCTAHGYAADVCGCGVCGSWGACTWSCNAATNPALLHVCPK